MAQAVDIKALLEAGAHFGHKTSRWHPKMAPYIHSKRGGIHIIDLTKTVEALEKALSFVELQSSKGHQILFVGTKKQSTNIIKETAESAGQPYVTERWLGGMLTNSSTISGRIKKLKDLESKMASGELATRYNKLEVQRFQEQIDSMNVLYGGVKDLRGKPGALFINDILENDIAVKEATKLGVPIIAIVDTNTDPTGIDYPIPANDDSISTVKYICALIAEAVKSGATKQKATQTEEK
jgi:small subunit ribosomal protein S2